jgi:hypothetical protein
MNNHTVFVWDEPCTVTVRRKSKSAWIASGDYKGTTITVEDQTEGAAVKRWREAAQYQGNG